MVFVDSLAIPTSPNIVNVFVSCTSKRLTRSQPSSVSIGDVVIVHDEHLPHGLWKLGKIISVMKGRDGRIRGATVQIAASDMDKKQC